MTKVKPGGTSAGETPATTPKPRRRTRKPEDAPVAAPAETISPEERQFMIGEAAYYRALERRFDGGDSLEDWLVAEREIARRYPTGDDVERDIASGVNHGLGIKLSIS